MKNKRYFILLSIYCSFFFKIMKGFIKTFGQVINDNTFKACNDSSYIYQQKI